MPQVGLNETRDIIGHFTGTKDAGDMIDFAVRTQTLLNVQDYMMGARGSSGQQPMHKQQVGGAGHPGMPPRLGVPGEQMHQRKRELKMNEKLEEQKDRETKMSVNDFLNERERKLHNRLSVMQSSSFNYLKVALLGYERQADEGARHRIQIL